MTIQINEYLLVPSENALDRFDLNKKVIREKKVTKEKYESITNLGYAMTLQNCIKEIIAIKLDEDKSIVSLNEFVLAYEKQRELIMNIIK